MELVWNSLPPVSLDFADTVVEDLLASILVDLVHQVVEIPLKG